MNRKCKPSLKVVLLVCVPVIGILLLTLFAVKCIVWGIMYEVDAE